MSSKIGPDFSTKITSKLKLPKYQKKSEDFLHRKFTLKVQFLHFAVCNEVAKHPETLMIADDG